jgi:phosphatidylserine/phosphatidylglycerophosphate/cardiolipin synthase-like enzyme
MPSTTWKFYTRSADAWEVMCADCNAARESIDIEQFIFGNDEIGKRFFEILEKKAAEGVKVRITCDAVGSFDLLNSKASDALAAKALSPPGFCVTTGKYCSSTEAWRTSAASG